MKPLNIPNDLTYVGVFLTLRCRYKCSYCINKHGTLRTRKELTSEEWIEGLNRLQIPREWMVPLTFQGGEPSAYKGWMKVIQGLNENFYIDILTNMDFDIKKFMSIVPPEKMQRDVPYACIRASYHPGYSKLEELLEKVYTLQNTGYSIGLFAVDHPDGTLHKVKEKAKAMGIDFRTKEFLGWHKGVLWGEYQYPLDFKAQKSEHVQCKTTEILIGPDGYIYKCHRDLYAGECPIGHILEEDWVPELKFRECDHRLVRGQYPECSCCDVKNKNNRFQIWGNCSVEII